MSIQFLCIWTQLQDHNSSALLNLQIVSGWWHGCYIPLNGYPSKIYNPYPHCFLGHQNHIPLHFAHFNCKSNNSLQIHFSPFIFSSRCPDCLPLPHWNKCIFSMHINHKYIFITLFCHYLLYFPFYMTGEERFRYSLK